ncbi:MAG: hypothetical protein HY911_00900 [Desulfobacterales bacterium]|nr:hypothetical protein [Desulfobacterales bacterium]
MAKKKVESSPLTGGPSASAAASRSAPASLPVGGIASAGLAPLSDRLFSTRLAALEADASDELGDLAPTFGDVLLSIGLGISESQAALDQGLVSAARQLSQTKISVISEVIQELDDNGLPNAAQTQLIENEVSLINFVNPTVHEWKHMALSMDLSVGETDYERGMTFNRTQRDISTHAYGLFWGFLGWFDTDDRTQQSGQTTRTDQETDWAQGQVRMDALLGPRVTGKFPVPAEVAIGPQIYFSHGSVQETVSDGVVSERAMDLLIRVRKANGDVNPNVNLVIEAPSFSFSFIDDATFNGSTANADGEIKVRLSRSIPNARFLRAVKGTVVARLGDLKQSTVVSL